MVVCGCYVGYYNTLFTFSVYAHATVYAFTHIHVLVGYGYTLRHYTLVGYVLVGCGLVTVTVTV